MAAKKKGVSLKPIQKQIQKTERELKRLLPKAKGAHRRRVIKAIKGLQKMTKALSPFCAAGGFNISFGTLC